MRDRRWREAIEDSLESLTANKTWEVVDKPEDANLVSTKWVFKTKRLPDVSEGKVLKLNRSLEGLKQSGRVWNRCISKSFKDFGLLPTLADTSVFVSKDKALIVALYVDDLLIFSSDPTRIKELKNYLLDRFRVRDMGTAPLILSISITRDRENKKITLDQEHYIRNLMEKYDISDDNARRISTPASSHESLLPKTSKEIEAEAD
ncbi:Retrovirus-related Pol polyprotein from transposon TNT 1-94, partial [Golovinomyces cichoracearum]